MLVSQSREIKTVVINTQNFGNLFKDIKELKDEKTKISLSCLDGHIFHNLKEDQLINVIEKNVENFETLDLEYETESFAVKVNVDRLDGCMIGVGTSSKAVTHDYIEKIENYFSQESNYNWLMNNDNAIFFLGTIIGVMPGIVAALTFEKCFKNIIPFSLKEVLVLILIAPILGFFLIKILKKFYPRVIFITPSGRHGRSFKKDLWWLLGTVALGLFINFTSR